MIGLFKQFGWSIRSASQKIVELLHCFTVVAQHLLTITQMISQLRKIPFR